MTDDLIYVTSDTLAVLSCLGMTLRFCLLIRRASGQVAPVRKAMVRVGGWIILLFVVLGFFIGTDTVNLLFHMFWKSGRFRNFGVALTVLIVGLGLGRDLSIIYVYIDRPAHVPIPPHAPVVYPPIPPMPTWGTAEDFAKYANTEAPPMPSKESPGKESPTKESEPGKPEP